MPQLVLPIFARASTVSVLERSLTEGVLKDIDRICWCYIVDDGTLAYVDTSKNIHKIVGFNKKDVIRANTLPSVAEGDTATLYIVDNVVYTFDGTQYKPSFYEVKIELDTLSSQVDGIDNRLEIAESNIQSVRQTLIDLGVSVSSVQAELSNKANTNDVYNKTAVDDMLAEKANSEDVYNKSEIDTAFATVNDTLATKADADSVYDKTEIDTALNLKADKADTYTKEEVDEKTHVEIPGGSSVSMVEYVDLSAQEAVQNANDYTDQQLAILFI